MPDRVIVVGASGFGRECLDVLEAMIAAGVELEVVGVIDDAPSAVNLERLTARRVPHLGGLNGLLEAGETDIRYVLGIGDPAIRRSLASRLDAAGFAPFTAVHPSAIAGSVCQLGAGVVVCSGAVISTNVVLGEHVHVNPNATIGHDAALEDYVSVNPAAIVSGEVVVGAGTLVGAGATILQGLTVGEGVTVGAGAVVTRNVPSGAVVTGVPGRWVGP